MALGDLVPIDETPPTLDENEGVVVVFTELERPGEDGRRRAARGSLLDVGVKVHMPDIGTLPAGTVRHRGPSHGPTRPLTRTGCGACTLGTNQEHWRQD